MRVKDEGLDDLVIGGGISGLGLAWGLLRRGRPCSVLEAGPGPGGLAGPLRLAGQPVERYYHYACPADTALAALSRELGVAWRWSPATQAVWAAGWKPLNGPIDLARFPLSPLAKLRLAAGALSLGGAEPGLGDDGGEARDWLRGRFGAEAAEALFLPLVRGKFGEEPLSAAWMRHRLWRSRHGAQKGGLPMAGSPEGGYAAFFGALAEGLRARGARLRFNAPVRSLRHERGAWTVQLRGGGRLRARRIHAALPAPRLLELLPPAARSGPWARALRGLRWRALVQPVFALKRPVSPYFWNNLSEAFTPFNGVVQAEHLRSLPFSLAYLPAYVDAASPWLRRSQAEVLQAARASLLRLQPALRPSDILAAQLSREALAQPILPPGSAARLPGQRSGLPGLAWLDACHLHPSDRSLDACLRAAERLLTELDHA